MAFDPGLVDWVAEAMAPIGEVRARPMMGGATLYCDGIPFAIIAGGQLWFKAGAHSDAIWDAEECPRFTFETKGKTGSMNYRRAPDAVYDEADALRRWGSLGLEAGQRAPRKKPKPKRT